MLAARARLLPPSGEIGQGERERRKEGTCFTTVTILHRGHDDEILDIAFDSTGQHLATASADGECSSPLLPPLFSYFPPSSHSLQTPSPPTVPLLSDSLLLQALPRCSVASHTTVWPDYRDTRGKYQR